MLDQASLNTLALTAVLILAGVYLLRPTKAVFPTINKYPGDFRSQRAYREIHDNARKLVIEGLAKHKGPVSLAIPYGRKILLPASLADWVKSNKDLDHKKLVKEDFFADIPGFDAQTLLHSSDSTVLNVIKTKLGQNNSIMGIMHASIAKGLEEIWGDEREWHTVNWYSDTMELIARVASSVFVGPEKAADREWLDLVQGYVMAYFTAVGELHHYPLWSRSIVHWFLPNAVACRKHVARARILMRNVVAKRHEAIRKAEFDGQEPPKYNDALFWVEAASGGKIEPGDAQLSLAMAALFTTTELFRQLLIDTARDPEITEKLRDEVSQQISAHGISVAATSNMVLLDSVMKESQRLSSSAGSYSKHQIWILTVLMILPSGSGTCSSQRHDTPRRLCRSSWLSYHG